MSLPPGAITALKVMDYTVTHEFSFFRRRKGKVLVIEDNPNDVLLITRALALCKRSFTVAYNAEAAEAYIERNGYTLAFVDLRLPTMSGQRLIQLIRDRCPHTHIVVVPGEVRDLADIPEEIVYSVILKPVTVEKLRDFLEKVKG